MIFKMIMVYTELVDDDNDIGIGNGIIVDDNGIVVDDIVVVVVAVAAVVKNAPSVSASKTSPKKTASLSTRLPISKGRRYRAPLPSGGTQSAFAPQRTPGNFQIPKHRMTAGSPRTEDSHELLHNTSPERDLGELVASKTWGSDSMKFHHQKGIFGDYHIFHWDTLGHVTSCNQQSPYWEKNNQLTRNRIWPQQRWWDFLGNLQGSPAWLSMAGGVLPKLRKHHMNLTTFGFSKSWDLWVSNSLKHLKPATWSATKIFPHRLSAPLAIPQRKVWTKESVTAEHRYAYGSYGSIPINTIYNI